jgi:hypothetical protein
VFQVGAPHSDDQRTDESAEEVFASFARVVNELEEAQIDR